MPVVQSGTSPAVAGTAPRLPCADPYTCGHGGFDCGGPGSPCRCALTTEGDNVCVSALTDLCDPRDPHCRPGFECFCPEPCLPPGVCVRFCSSAADCGPGVACVVNVVCTPPRGVCAPLATPGDCAAPNKAPRANSVRLFARGR